MKKLLTVLGVLVLAGAGCSSGGDVDDNTADTGTTTTPTAQESLSPEVAQIKSTFETLEIAAQTDHCDSILLNIAPSAGATEADCAAILSFAKANPLVSAVDWPATQLDGKTGKLYRPDGSLMMNLEYDDSGVLWGYKIADKFWAR